MKKNGFSAKVLAVFLAVALCMPCFAFSAFADETGKLSMSSIEAKSGDLISVSINITNNPGIAGIKLNISFDNAYLTPVSVKAGSALNTSIISNIQSASNVASLKNLTAVFYGVENVYKTGSIVVVTFRIKETDKDVMTYVSAVCEEATNENLDDVIFGAVSSRVSIAAAEADDKDDKEEITPVKADIDLKRGASKMKYMAGYSDGTFKPTQAATRYEVVECFNELFDVGLKVDQSISFKDVDSKHNAMVKLFAAAGVINGYPSDNTFRGTKTITRAEFCKIVTVLLDLDVDRAIDQGFNDVKSHWAKDFINICAREGLVQGKGAGRFDPDGEIKRCEVVTLINRITGAKAGTSCSYSDVPSDAWYFGAVAAAAK